MRRNGKGQLSEGVALGTKKLGSLEQEPENCHFSFPARLAGHALLQADLALGTKQAIGVHRGADGQCADAIEGQALVLMGRNERIHMGTGNRGLGQMKGGDEAAYVCPNVQAELLVY